MDKTTQQAELRRNRITFGLGTIGRDMLYSMVSMYLLYYLTEVLDLSTTVMWWVAAIMLIARIWDAVNDPFMGFIVDNTHTRWGKFKPWIAIGALLSGILTVLFFTEFGFEDTAFIIAFAVIYFLWEMAFTANDIAYWSMLPALSTDQKERERIGSIARICANIGLFAVVVGITPLTKMIGDALGSWQKGYFVFALIVAVIMVAGQCITLFGVKEPKLVTQEKKTSLREMFNAIVKNDQLLFTAIAMSLFMIGYMTTTSFGQYFFTYAYGDEGMYSIFGLILGVSQIAALSVFPLFSKRFNRRKLYTAATILIVIGYIVFFFAPTNTMIFIGIAGILLFVGQAFIQLLMLMFLADSVDYGHWKLGKRNESITFALQPFINKIGGAVANGIVAAVVIISGIKDASTPSDVTAEGLLMMKTAMLVLPAICIAVSFVIYRLKYKIDEKTYATILADLRERGEMLPAIDESES